MIQRSWRLPLIGVIGFAAILFAAGMERARSCSVRGGRAEAFGTRCRPPVLHIRGAAGEATQLSFDPQLPAPGSVVHATFATTVPELAAQPRVVLRARLRSADSPLNGSEPTVLVLGSLDAVGDGRFTGSFRVPPDVSYAKLVIESEDGEIVEANSAQMFELLTADGDGSPSYESLIGRAREHLMNDPVMLVETGRLLQQSDPARPWGAYVRQAGEGALDDRTREAHYATEAGRLYRRYDARLRRAGSVAAADMELMRNWTRSDFDNDGERYWRDRAIDEHPHTRIGLLARALRATEISNEDPIAQLDSLEAIWRDSPVPEKAIAGAGWATAQLAREEERLATWSARFESANPRLRIRADERLATDSVFMHLGEMRLRSYVDSLLGPDGFPRTLGETRTEHERDLKRTRWAAMAALARVLIATNRSADALRLLDDAEDPLLSAGYLIARARARQAQRDPAGAEADLIVAAAADEGLTAALADSARAVMAGGFDHERWSARVAAARAARDAAILSAPPGPAIGEDRIRANDGSERSVAEVADGGPIVVAVIRANALKRSGMAHRGVAQALSAVGARWIYLDLDEPHAADESIPEPWHEHDAEYHDVDGQLLRDLAPRFVPQYYLIDRSGRVRFVTRDLREVHDLAMVLSRN